VHIDPITGEVTREDSYDVLVLPYVTPQVIIDVKLEADAFIKRSCVDGKIYLNPRILTYDGLFSVTIIDCLNSTVKAQMLNQTLCSLVDDLWSNNIVAAYNALLSTIEDKYDWLKSMVQGCIHAYSTGGFKGLVVHLVQLAAEPRSITEDNGVLKWTSPSTMMPREYIAGMIAGLIGTVVSVVGLILSIVSRVASVALTVLGTLISGIANSFKYDSDNTCCLWQAVGDQLVIPACPVPITHEEIAMPEWYHEYYLNGQSVVIMYVPGAVILIGPGPDVANYFDNLIQGEEDLEIPDLRVEVHASLTMSCETRAFHDFITDTVYLERSGASQLYPCLYMDKLTLDYSNTVKRVYDLCVATAPSVPFLSANQNDEPYNLSSNDDKLLYAAVASNTFIFLMFMLLTNDSFSQAISAQDKTHADELRLDDDSLLAVSARDAYLYSESDAGYKTQWANYVTGAESLFSQVDDAYLINGFKGTPIKRSTTYVGTRTTFKVGRYFTEWFVNQGHSYGDPVSVSASMKYAFNVPVYNARTFWFWIVTAALTTAVVATVAVIATVKFKQFCTLKRERNHMLFDDAQEQYRNALKGDPDDNGNPTFDPSSEEGKAIIRQRGKAFRKQALKNNLWANVIGGSRYEVGSFWGEKDTSDGDSSIVSSAQDAFQSMFVDTPLANEAVTPVEEPSTSLDSIRYLITGYTPANT
jgi:hypothetical protein